MNDTRRFLSSLHVLLSVLFALCAWFSPSTASAQGRCRCNNGCHQYPGQCVQRGAAGCDEGFAPFCANRSATCPNAGWVSCSGECTCVRIAPAPDAGTVDVVTPPADVGAPVDRPVSPDVVSPPIDVPRPLDVPAAPDVVIPTVDGSRPLDAPRAPDVPVVVADGAFTPSDSSATPIDVPASFDVVMTPSDTPQTSRDVPCICPAGICVDGYCVTMRCTFAPELGFICREPGTVCRLVGAEPWCVPACVGVSCAANEFCDESSGGCMRDNCMQIRCPVGTICQRNQCGRFGDGGVFVPIEDAGAPADGGRSSTGVDDGGCGCRTPRRDGASMRAFALLGLGLVARRRRRIRKPTKSSPN